jgi:hypothetical protein
MTTPLAARGIIGTAVSHFLEGTNPLLYDVGGGF